MGKRTSLAVIACAIALALSLAGCSCGAQSTSSSSSNRAAAAEAFTGTWDLAGWTKQDQAADSDVLGKLEQNQGKVFLNLNPNGDADLQLFDSVLFATWRVRDDGAGTMELDDGQVIDLTLTDGELSFTQDGYTMTFEPGDPKEVTASRPQTESLSDAVVADDELFTVTLVEKRSYGADDTGFVVAVANKTDKDVYITGSLEPFTVAGITIDALGGETVAPGASAELYIWFEGLEGLAELHDVEGTLFAWEDSTLQDVASYPVRF